MKSVKGTKTEQNLLKAFAGESQARNRYTFFASIAKKEGYEKIAFYFLETAQNEQEHAKLFFKCLEGGMVEITASYPAGVISNTIDNLKHAAEGEDEEWDTLYPSFADVADAEGFPQIAILFRNIATIEKHHAERYHKLAATLEGGAIFKKENETEWRCRNCGHVTTSKNAPDVCPACKHAQAYYEIFSDLF